MKLLIQLTQLLSRSFAFWVLFFVALAFIQPQWFTVFAAYIPWFLGVIMFGMGITLSPNDFKAVMKYPKAVAIGVCAQFILMPLIAYALVIAFQLPKDIAIGIILVGCCPGGTASNVITFLAKGNTALSLVCTSVATLLAPILTPAIFYLLASQWLDIDAYGMFVSVLQMILLPIILGVGIRVMFGKHIQRIAQVTPMLSIVAIVVIIAAIVAVSREKILTSGLLILSVVILHNALGLFFGYWISKFMRLDEADSKAISIEVGMQNSGLGAALAAMYFEPISAVPSAIFSFWHNISGSILATYWSRKS